MAEKRMFSLNILDTDWFLDLPLSTQMLYVHLSMRADDDGFVDSPKSIIRKIGASVEDYKTLLEKRFVLDFPNGVCVIKHWRVHNTIQKDRYKETRFKEEKETLVLREDKIYTEMQRCIQDGNSLDTKCIPSIISKPKSNTNNNTNNIIVEDKFIKPTIEEIQQYCNERQNNVDAEKFYNHYESKGWKVGKSSMKNWKACVRTWERTTFKNDSKKEEKFNNYNDEEIVGLI